MNGESSPASFEPEPLSQPDVHVKFVVAPPKGEELGPFTIVSDEFGTAVLLTKRGQAEYGRTFGRSEDEEQSGEASEMPPKNTGAEGDDEHEA